MYQYTIWETMKEKNKTTYDLIYRYDINPRIITKLKRNENITIITLEKLCKALECNPNEIVKIY